MHARFVFLCYQEKNDGSRCIIQLNIESLPFPMHECVLFDFTPFLRQTFAVSYDFLSIPNPLINQVTNFNFSLKILLIWYAFLYLKVINIIFRIFLFPYIILFGFLQFHSNPFVSHILIDTFDLCFWNIPFQWLEYLILLLKSLFRIPRYCDGYHLWSPDRRYDTDMILH